MRHTRYIHNLKLLCFLPSHFFSVATIHTDNKVTIFHNQLNVDGITERTKRYIHWQVKIEFLIINTLEKVILRTGDWNEGHFTRISKIYILMRLFSKAWFAVFSGYPPSPDNNNILLNRCYPSTNITMGTSEMIRSIKWHSKNKGKIHIHSECLGYILVSLYFSSVAIEISPWLLVI